MRQVDKARAAQLHADLQAYSANIKPLPGVAQANARESLVRQMIDSLHRIEYVQRIGERPIDPRRRDPRSPLFDPLKAAHLYLSEGEVDEAAWLVFLSTHFGYHRHHRWELTRRVYGALNGPQPWTWARTSNDVAAFRAWFIANAVALADIPFGNHRKYESIRPDADNNLADTVASYINWVGANRGFALLISEAANKHGHAPKPLFDGLYKELKVAQFGRTAKFDFLTMLGKLSIADIEPPVPYLVDPGGPLRGARLLFSGATNAQTDKASLSGWVVQLGDALGVGMQVMEDSLCNWQKSQFTYLPFRG